MNDKLCDRVIVSGDENRLYLDFWPFVAYAYRTIFPGVKVTLALTVWDRLDEGLMRELHQHGQVLIAQAIDGYPMASQAKMARFRAAAAYPDEVCYIDDLDMIPIDREWHISKTAQREPDSLLLIGREVYGNAYPNQVPVSMMTAEGRIFKELFGQVHNTVEWFQWLYESRVNDTDHSNIKLATFSDEALIVQLRKSNPVRETHVERGYVTGQNTIDRGCWPFSQRRLEEGGYIAAHTARPYRDFKSGNDAIMAYIKQRYNGDDLPQPLSVK